LEWSSRPPLRVERREELLWLFGQPCELEHGLMCEYLFAQFTLKRSPEEGLTAEQSAKVAAWETVLIDVVKQEMLHLALAANLLTAIGAAPHLPCRSHQRSTGAGRDRWCWQNSRSGG